ncbi:hypothetical protein DH2020_016821 [Rehmannia glutinosa]|uniref:Ataxin 2 SM domain-containing protein n=1 Tax=Rehmannia glutinosa TaxID=99300 RepID=A0ABR0WRR1_REHGL
MACRKGELREEGRNRNAAAAAATSLAVSDALLFTTMCIIGMPVDVHAKDGSIYSGIFHTASVDKDYAIALKKARMIKKGTLDANVVNGTLIETLIVRSEDLVQVVAKAGYVRGDGIEAAAGYTECLDRDAEVVKPNELKGKKKHKSQSRYSAKRENGFPYAKTAKLLGSSSENHIERLETVNFVKIGEAHNSSIDGRQDGDRSQEIQSDCNDNPEVRDKRTIDEAQGLSLSMSSCEAQSTASLNILEDTIQKEPKGVSSGCSNALKVQDQGRPTSDETDETACTVASLPILDVKSESCLSASSNPFLWVPPKSSSVKRTTKESKLNPGAKTFSPSMLQHRTVTPPAVANGASVAYMPGTYTIASMVTTQEEVDASSFARSSVPVKFVPYNNVAFGHGGNDAPYVQPDAQSATGLSPATTRPLLTPHQVHLPKHQGNASAQALQLCMTPSIMANGPQPFVMPSSIPISQSAFPVLRPIAVPGSNGFLSTKFA